MSIYNLRPYIGNTPLIGGYNLGPYIGRLITRNFTTLDSAFMMHWTIPTVALTGDFEIEVNALLPASAPAGNEAIIGDTSLTWLIFMGSDGTVTAQQPTGIGSLDIKVTPTELGKYSHITYQRVGDDITLTVDGVSTLVNRPDWGSIAPSRIGAVGSILYYDGIIADVEIYDAGTLVRKYSIDQTWIGPSTELTDTSGNNQHGTAVNIDVDDSENFTFDGSVSPNTWTNDDELRVIEVAGT